MKIRQFLCVVALAATIPFARADDWDQKTVFTFSAPVEIPGQVLMPGTYVFKLADSSSDRNIVQVYDKDQQHLYGTFLAIPDYRLKPSDKPIITFSEQPVGTPEAVKAWFYPGENYGHDFVYPKPKAVVLAKANNTPVASMPAELEEHTKKPATTMQEPHVVEMKAAPVKAQKPTGEEVETVEVFTVQELAQATPPPARPAPPAAAPAPAPKQLPATASNYPLIGVIGLLCLAAAFALRLTRVRVH